MSEQALMYIFFGPVYLFLWVLQFPSSTWTGDYFTQLLLSGLGTMLWAAVLSPFIQ